MMHKSLWTYRHSLIAFLTSLIILQVVSCTYLRVRMAGTPQLASLVTVGQLHKHFIIHDSEKIYQLTNPSIENKELSGTYQSANFQPVYYYEGRPNRYRKEERMVVHEVHIYVNTVLESNSGALVDIPLADVTEVRIIEQDTGATVASYVFGIIGGVLAFTLIMFLIILATKSSCPFVYTYDGNGFIFNGEIFGGAIFKGLERDDYMPLPELAADGGVYRVRISNELKERQFINLAELQLVEHPENTKVLIDGRGLPRLIQEEMLPERARSKNGKDLLPVLEQIDRQVYSFDELSADTNQVELSFTIPEDARRAKLVLNVQNHLWLDYLFGTFTEKFGWFYEDWIDKQNKMPADLLEERSNHQPLALSVLIETRDGWQLVERIPTIGPLAPRDMVVPVPLANIQGDQLKVRLQTGFLFWDLDYAAMDFSKDRSLLVHKLHPLQAVTSNEEEISELLTHADEKYYQQDRIGDMVEIHYRAIQAAEGNTLSAFLHARGYYNHVRDYKGLPKIGQLIQFKRPNYFDEYSRNVFLEWVAEEDQLATTSGG
jgi:hypothetical protein